MLNTNFYTFNNKMSAINNYMNKFKSSNNSSEVNSTHKNQIHETNNTQNLKKLEVKKNKQESNIAVNKNKINLLDVFDCVIDNKRNNPEANSQSECAETDEKLNNKHKNKNLKDHLREINNFNYKHKKNFYNELKIEKESKILTTEENNNINNFNPVNKAQIESQIANNLKNNKTNSPFLNKQRFILKKTLQFKDDDENEKQMNLKKKKISIPKNEEKRKEVNKIRKDYSEVKAKVKTFIDIDIHENKEKDKILGSSKKSTNKRNEASDDSEVSFKNKRKRRKTTDNNYVRLNLKGGYKERKLVRHKNIRRIKLDRAKSYYKYREKLLKNKDQKFMGMGKDGLDDDFLSDEDEDFTDNSNDKKNASDKIQAPKQSENLFDNNDLNINLKNGQSEKILNRKIIGNTTSNKDGYKDYLIKNQEYKKVKIPNFSEGYYLSEILSNSGSTNNPCDKKEYKSYQITNKMKELLKLKEQKVECRNLSIEKIIKIYRNEIELLLCQKEKEIKDNKEVVIEMKENKNINLLSEKTKKIISEKLNAKKYYLPLLSDLENTKEIFINTDTEKKSLQNFHDRQQIHAKLDDSDNKILTTENDYHITYYKSLSDEEFVNYVFENILHENFNHKKFLKNQLDAIKNLINNNDTLLVSPPCSGKSLVFHLLSLVFDGITIVICPLISSISQQLVSLPDSIPGASLSSFTENKNKLEIMQSIKNNKIKIIFATPERLAFESLYEFGKISLIVFDDATDCCPISPSFRSSYLSIKLLINQICKEKKSDTSQDNNKLDKDNSDNLMDIVPQYDIPLNDKMKKNKINILLLANNSTNFIEKNIIDFYNINPKNIIKEKLTIHKNIILTASKEDSKTKLNSLLKILKSKHFKKCGPIIIFCNTKNSVDTVRNFLFQNTFNVAAYHSTKTELERQEIQTKFNNKEIEILVATSSYSTAITQVEIKLKIIYEFPCSLEILFQEIGSKETNFNDTIDDTQDLTTNISKNKNLYVHIFCNDDDYYSHRNVILQDLCDKMQIVKFLNYFFSIAVQDKFNSKFLDLGKKRNYSTAFENNKLSSGIDNINLEEDEENIIRNNKIAEKDQDDIYNIDDELSMEVSASENIKLLEVDFNELNKNVPLKICFNFTKANEISGMKKMMQLFLLNSLFEGDNIKRDCNDTFPDIKKNNENSRNQNINLESNLLKGECFGIGPVDINLRFFKSKPKELAERDAIVKFLLANSREFSGGVYKFNLMKICSKLELSHLELLNYLFQLQNKSELGYEGNDEAMFISINKFPITIKSLINKLSEINMNFIETCINKLSALYVLLRKFSINSLDAFLNVFNQEQAEIRTLDYFKSFNQYQHYFKEAIETYFKDQNDKETFYYLMNDIEEFNIMLPIIIVEDPEEKKEILKDISYLIERELNKNLHVSTMEILQILFGITSSTKVNYNSNPLWCKYKQYDFNWIFKEVESLIYSLKPKIFQKQNNLPNKKNMKLA